MVWLCWILDAVLTIEPNWSSFFIGEFVTFMCDMNEGADTDWKYKLNKDGREFVHYNTNKFYRLPITSTSYSGEYQCFGSRKSSHDTESSNTVSVTVSGKSSVFYHFGGSVTLTCSVGSSAEWKYEWFRRIQNTNEVQIKKDDQPNRVIRVSQGGIYRCRGIRGDPVYYTDISAEVSIEITFRLLMVWLCLILDAVLTIEPNWSRFFIGEVVTFICNINEGADTDWEYKIKKDGQEFIPYNTHKDYKLKFTSADQSGKYQCSGRRKSSHDTESSNTVSVTVSGKSSINGDDTEWEYEWRTPSSYKPKREILTFQAFSFNGGDYACKGRMKNAPQFSTEWSDSFSLKVSDSKSHQTSLTVSPDRVQHFTSDSVSLTCEGNSSEWRVKKFTEDSRLNSDCWTMTGSTCNISYMLKSHTAVYWCESGSGKFSNAVNITVQDDKDVILVSPAHPVTEGDPVTLVCKLRTKSIHSHVFFYKNDKLIQNDSRGELSMSAVSKSDEGFYKCQHSGKESPQSWMPVKCMSMMCLTNLCTRPQWILNQTIIMALKCRLSPLIHGIKKKKKKS
uniref:Ig-like domain-containing protein n=1 Tax=Amphilophus citrinellus TaxID=61819 RepID=A0A3Q0SGY2_AMPCI